MNIAIIEDFKEDADILYRFLSEYAIDNKLLIRCTVFENGNDFLEQFSARSYDLIFIDIYLNGEDGLEIAKEIRQKDEKCLLVFTTSSSAHAIKSYTVRAFDYLLKPIDPKRLKYTLDLCNKALFDRSRYIEVKEGRIFTKIRLSDIVYTDYYNHYIQIHTKDRMVKTYMPFADFSPMLLGYSNFINCYRNCIVNLDEVDFLSARDFIMKTGEKVPISRSDKTKITQLYADYEFNKLNGG